MRTTFVNKNLPINPMSSGKGGNGSFDLISKLFQMQSVVENFEKESQNLQSKHNTLLSRQEKESIEVKALVEDLFLTEYYSKSAIYNSNALPTMDSISFFSEESSSLEIDGFEIKGLNKNLSFIETPTNARLENNKVYSSFQKKCYFSEIYFKVPNSQKGSLLVINKKLNDIVSMSVRSPIGTWVDIFSSDFLRENISPSDKCFFSIDFEQDSIYFEESNEFKIVIKNNKIGKFYYLNAEFKILKKDISIISSKEVFYNSTLNVNSLTLDSPNPSFFEGSIKINNKSYSIQIPSFISETSRYLALSKLELVERQQTYSIFKCPYPVDIEGSIALNSISLSSALGNSNFNIKDFKISTNKNNWFRIEEIESSANESNFYYSTEYSTTPKYFYVKLDTLQSNAYMTYTLKKNINCAWPVSEDGEIMFNGTGVSLKTPTSNFQLKGKVNFIGSMSTYASFLPIARLGVN